MIPNLHHLTGLDSVASDRPSTQGDHPSLESVAVTHDHPSLWSPDNPLLWFGGVLALTLGLIGISGSVRLGRAKVSASVGSA